MMTSRKDIFYWQSNDDWWSIDEGSDKFILSDSATDEARESFKKYLEFIEEEKRTGAKII